MTITGLYFEKGGLVDIGTLVLVASFFFLVRSIPLNYLTLILILSMFFIFLSLWLFMRRFLIVTDVKKGMPKREVLSHLAEYKKDSTLYYLRTLVLGYGISLLGGIIAIHSFIGPFPAHLSVFIKTMLTISVIVSVYSVLFLIPRYIVR